MSFAELYNQVQKNSDFPISTRWLKERALECSTIIRIIEHWSSSFDSRHLRGFYIEGPLGPPIPLAENESLITLSRAMCKGPQGGHWRCFVYTKELMHVFDTDEEKAGNDGTFDRQVEKFANPSLKSSPQYQAEAKAFWRALMVLCPEAKRKELVAAVTAGAMSLDVMAASMRIPAQYARELLRPDFEAIANGLID